LSLSLFASGSWFAVKLILPYGCLTGRVSSLFLRLDKVFYAAMYGGVFIFRIFRFLFRVTHYTRAVCGGGAIRQSRIAPEFRAAPLPGKNPIAIAGVYCYRIPHAVRINCISASAVGVIVQGDKRVVAAGEEFRFGAGQYIAYGMGLPATSHIIGVSAETPHLALMIALDRALLCELAAGMEPGAGAGCIRG
jgi:hypothetical protein